MKPKVEVQNLRNVNTNNSVFSLMERKHEQLGHGINSWVQLIVYENTPCTLECCVTMTEKLRPQKKAKTDHLTAIINGYLQVGKEATNQKN